ncbi:hypothetical protein GGF50DRAFT_91726 [Schizophyllum commune]
MRFGRLILLAVVSGVAFAAQTGLNTLTPCARKCAAENCQSKRDCICGTHWMAPCIGVECPDDTSRLAASDWMERVSNRARRSNFGINSLWADGQRFILGLAPQPCESGHRSRSSRMQVLKRIFINEDKSSADVNEDLQVQLNHCHLPTVVLTVSGVLASQYSANLPRLADCAYHCGIGVCIPGTPLYDPTCDCLFASNHVNSYVASCMEQQCPRDQKDVAFGTLYTYCSRHSP